MNHKTSFSGSVVTGKLDLSRTNTPSRFEIRTHIRALRRNLSIRQQQLFGQQACALMLQQLSKRNPKHVALYLSNDGELDTQPLIEALWSQGINVYLPRLHPFSKGNLIFLNYTASSEMQENHLGINEPKLEIQALIPAEKLDVVITPLVAFDNQGNRMGMGGGYYDRTLANWTITGQPLPIGYAHDCQQVPALPCEHWDVPLPFIVTPTRVYAF